MLRERIKTSVILLLGVLVVLLGVPLMVRLAVFAALGIMAALEWSQFMSTRRSRRYGFVGGVVALTLVALVGTDQSLSAPLWLGLAVVFWLYMGVRIWAWPEAMPSLLKWLGGYAVLVPAALAVSMILTQEPNLRGSCLLLLLWAIVAAADVGAYFAGRAFGRHKLAPKVSPGKTWEGVLGGMVLAIVVGYLGALCLNLNPRLFLPLIVVLVAASIVGDLTESLYKRHAGVKDSGQFLPGHGGLMDRLDGLVAALPFYVLGLMLLGLWH